MNRADAARLISTALGERRLIWVGSHGIDADSLTLVPQFTHCFSGASMLGAPGVEEFSIEQQFGHRRPEHTDWALSLRYQALMDRLLAACKVPSVVAAFIPLPLFPPLEQARAHVGYLGTPWDRFPLFNSKDHVEGQLRRFAGDRIRLIDWEPLPPGEARFEVIRARVRQHPVVLRASVSQGGMGHELIQDEAELTASRLIHEDAVAVGPFLDPHVPLAVGGCVFPDGEVTLHCPSEQLIGLPHTARSPFGFSGNDFGAVRRLDRRTIDNLGAYAKIVGQWLHSEGYIGVFGIDALVHDDRLWFVELNPRFQGSTWIANRLDATLDVPDMVQDHLMAWLGVPSRTSWPLADLVSVQPARSQVLVFNRREERVTILADELRRCLPPDVDVALAPSPDVRVYPGEVICALEFPRGVSTAGRELDADVTALVDLAESCVALKGRPLRQHAPGSSRPDWLTTILQSLDKATERPAGG